MFRPAPDTTGAEADGILAALEHMPRDTILLTDAAAVTRAWGKRGRRGQVSGKVGQVDDVAAARKVQVRWRRRSDERIRAAHRAAREELRGNR